MFISFSFIAIKRERNEPKKEKNAKDYSVAARREIKWKQLKAKPSTSCARYRGYAARSHENPPALTRHLPYKGGEGKFRPACRQVAERARSAIVRLKG